VYTKSGAATNEVIKEQVKVLGQQMSVTDFLHKFGMHFALKNEIKVKINTL
jgi:hypothetical protein